MRSSNKSKLQHIHNTLHFDSFPKSEVDKTKVFLPGIIKSGFSENDANALLDACIRYGAGQAKEDEIYEDKKDWEKDIKIRPLEPGDFDVSIMAWSKIHFPNRNKSKSWNVSINPPEYYKITYELELGSWKESGKVFIIFGVEDKTEKQEEYPIQQLSIERSHVKVIDIVDVQDLYHSNYISFLTPVLYRNGDRGNISFKIKNPVQLNLKINGLVFFK